MSMKAKDKQAFDLRPNDVNRLGALLLSLFTPELAKGFTSGLQQGASPLHPSRKIGKKNSDFSLEVAGGNNAKKNRTQNKNNTSALDRARVRTDSKIHRAKWIDMC